MTGEQADGEPVANADECRRSRKKTKKKFVRQRASNVHELSRREEVQTTGRAAVRLPVVSRGSGGPRPVPGGAAADTLASFERQRGVKSRDYAVSCLELAQRFNERPWLQQLRQAVTIATIGVKRVYGYEPHLFAVDNAVV